MIIHETTTPKQQEMLDFIKSFIAENGWAPTVRECAAHFNLKSPNGAAVHLAALEKKGFISRGKKQGRSIRVL